MDPKASTSAGSATTSSQNQTNSRTDEIRCRICNSDLKISSPKLLPCLHTVCAQCLRKSAEGGPSNLVTRCPICRQMFNTADVIDNYFINSAAAMQNYTHYENKTCTCCDDNAKASWFCETCVEVLCDACKQAHQRVKLTKEHSVSMILHPSSADRASKRWFPPCPHHSGQVLWLYCTVCETLMCQQCQSSLHSTHRAQVVETTAQVVRRHYQGNCVVKLNEKLTQVKQVKEQLTKIKSEIMHHEYEITGKMRSLMEKLVMEITNRIVTLNNSLKESTKKKQQFLERQQMEVVHLERGITRCQEFIRNAMNSLNNAAVVSCGKTLNNQVDFLLRREPTKMPVAGLELTFLLNDNCNILKQLASLGHLIVRDPLERNIDKISHNVSTGLRPPPNASLISGTSADVKGLSAEERELQQSEFIKANWQKMGPTVRSMVANALNKFDKPNQQTNQQTNQQASAHPQAAAAAAAVVSTAAVQRSVAPRMATGAAPPRLSLTQAQSLKLQSQGVTLSVVRNTSPILVPHSPTEIPPNQTVASVRPQRKLLPRPMEIKETELMIPSISPNSVRSLNKDQEMLLHIPNIADELPQAGSEQNTVANGPVVINITNGPSVEASESTSVTTPTEALPSLVTTTDTSNTLNSTTVSTTSSATIVTTTEAAPNPSVIKIKPEPGTTLAETSSCQKEGQPLVNSDVLADGKFRVWSGQLTWREPTDKSKDSLVSSVKCNFHDFHSDASTSINVGAWPEKFSMHLIPRHYIKSIENHIKGAKKLFIEFDEDEENKQQRDKITASLLADMVGIACYFTGPTKIGVFIVACIRRLQKYVALVPAQQKEVLRTLRDVAGDKMRVYLQEIAKQQPKPVMPATVPDLVSPPTTTSASGEGDGVQAVESGKLANIGNMLEGMDTEYSNVAKKTNPDDPNDDWCAVCQNGGDLLCCDTCPRVFHLQCHIPSLLSTPNDSVPWNCTFCRDIAEEIEIFPIAENGDAQNTVTNGEESNENPRKRKREEEHLSERERKLCERVLLELFCLPPSIPFREPVGQDVPGYYQVITHAMDLSTIKARLLLDNPDYYHSVDEMLSDLKLMFSNCFAFNGMEASITQMAKLLQRHLNRLINQFLPDYGSEVDRNDPTWHGEDRVSKRKRKPKDIIHIK